MINQFRTAEKQIEKLRKQTTVRKHIKQKNVTAKIGTVVILDFSRCESDMPIKIEVAKIPPRSYWKHK